ncbi:DoxX family protein [Tropicimonas sp. TH_r6]|uniref:DoxX family protein n=1 Tax=Tropicimonas sp. TH_r6 TaxID=3082085 RepID=UPI002954F862|nr:DoxX family protein [Tropicimonas sp. TH_r6]MDV7143584.1 DoxX family protein [Tropicimonas sp. TH_r6]
MKNILDYTCASRFAANHMLLLLTLILTAGFCFAGYNKATQFWMMIFAFDGYGLPIWFMSFLGMAELSGAISLYLKRWALLGSVGLCVVLTGASSIHILNGDPIEIGGMAWIMTPMMYLVTFYHFRATQTEMEAASLAA